MIIDATTAIDLAYPIGVGIAACGGAIGLGMAVSAGLNGMSRQPEMSGKLLTNMIIGAAFIEACVIYALISYFIIK